MALDFDPDTELRRLRACVTAHRRAALRGKSDLAEDKAREAVGHAEAVLAWLNGGGELRSEWDRWA